MSKGTPPRERGSGAGSRTRLWASGKPSRCPRARGCPASPGAPCVGGGRRCAGWAQNCWRSLQEPTLHPLLALHLLPVAPVGRGWLLPGGSLLLRGGLPGGRGRGFRGGGAPLGPSPCGGGGGGGGGEGGLTGVLGGGEASPPSPGPEGGGGGGAGAAGAGRESTLGKEIPPLSTFSLTSRTTAISSSVGGLFPSTTWATMGTRRESCSAKTRSAR